MSAVMERLTLEKAIQALEGVKDEYEMDNGTLAIITPDQYDEACNIMANYFFPDNPLFKSFGVTWNELLNEVTLAILKMNLSVCMMTRDTREIMGVQITGVKTKSDPPENFCPEEEPLKALLTLTTLQEKEVNVFERYEVDEVVDFLALAVKEKYRRMGVAGRLFAASVSMCRELGFKAIKGRGTSSYSHKLYDKQGFEPLSTLALDTYYHNGQPVSEGTGGHTTRKLYGLKI
ncbi:hypothetical protein ABFA07_018366 [Porites harrisoni]